MKHLFEYNWMVRDDWFRLCSDLSHAELIKNRVGGVGSILETLFHIIDVECSWIQAISGNPISEPNYQDYESLELIKQLSDRCRLEISPYIDNWNSELEYVKVTPPWDDETFYCGEVIRHVIAHEIHHIGQLSIWAREMGLKPVSANFIGKRLMLK